MKRLLVLPLFLKYKYDLYQLGKRERLQVGKENQVIHRNEEITTGNIEIQRIQKTYYIPTK